MLTLPHSLPWCFQRQKQGNISNHLTKQTITCLLANWHSILEFWQDFPNVSHMIANNDCSQKPFLFKAVLDTQSKPCCMLAKCTATELHPQSQKRLLGDYFFRNLCIPKEINPCFRTASHSYPNPCSMFSTPRCHLLNDNLLDNHCYSQKCPGKMIVGWSFTLFFLGSITTIYSLLVAYMANGHIIEIKHTNFSKMNYWKLISYIEPLLCLFYQFSRVYTCTGIQVTMHMWGQNITLRSLFSPALLWDLAFGLRL